MRNVVRISTEPSIQKKALGEQHSDTILSLRNLAAVEVCLGKHVSALHHFDQARGLAAARRQHSAGTRRARAAHVPVANRRDLFSPRFFVQPDAASGSSRRGKVGWRVINGKAETLQAISERSLLARDSQNPALREIATGIANVRGNWRQSPCLPPRRVRKVSAEQIFDLEHEERKLSRQLGYQTAKAASTDSWIELDAIRKSLPLNRRWWKSFVLT